MNVNINALKDLIRQKGFSLNKQSVFRGEANVVASRPKRAMGSVSFDIFCSVHSVDTSSIFFSDEIRSFGIPYQEHKPMFGAMKYTPANDRLNFEDTDYAFYLEDIQLT